MNARVVGNLGVPFDFVVQPSEMICDASLLHRLAKECCLVFPSSRRIRLEGKHNNDNSKKETFQGRLALRLCWGKYVAFLIMWALLVIWQCVITQEQCSEHV